MTPCKIIWTGPDFDLPSLDGGHLGRVTAGAEGVLVYPGLAAFSPDLALLYRVDAEHYDVHSPGDASADAALGGWDGVTVTPVLVKTLLDLDDAIPTLVKVMNENPALGPKVVQGVMAGMS